MAAPLFYDPKGNTLFKGGVAMGQATTATLSVTADLKQWTYWDPTSCGIIKTPGFLQGIQGQIAVSLLDAASLSVMALALFGSSAGSVISIGGQALEEFELSFSVYNRADECRLWEYAFPRCRLGPNQEHIFGVAADATDPTPQAITFIVERPEGSPVLGTITRG